MANKKKLPYTPILHQLSVFLETSNDGGKNNMLRIEDKLHWPCFCISQPAHCNGC